MQYSSLAGENERRGRIARLRDSRNLMFLGVSRAIAALPALEENFKRATEYNDIKLATMEWQDGCGRLANLITEYLAQSARLEELVFDGEVVATADMSAELEVLRASRAALLSMTETPKPRIERWYSLAARTTVFVVWTDAACTTFYATGFQISERGEAMPVSFGDTRARLANYTYAGIEDNITVR